jgi:hypothetical protein
MYMVLLWLWDGHLWHGVVIYFILQDLLVFFICGCGGAVVQLC